MSKVKKIFQNFLLWKSCPYSLRNYSISSEFIADQVRRSIINNLLHKQKAKMSNNKGGQGILLAKTMSQPPIISIKIVSSSRTDAGATVSTCSLLQLVWLANIHCMNQFILTDVDSSTRWLWLRLLRRALLSCETISFLLEWTITSRAMRYAGLFGIGSARCKSCMK
jgi:hypothetical protein